MARSVYEIALVSFLLIFYLMALSIHALLLQINFKNENIKISIITTCKNSDKHIAYSLVSVRNRPTKH